MTTRERAKSIGAGVGVFALLLAAVVGVVLAVDLLRAENRVDAADAAFTSGVERNVTWDADTLLPTGVSRAILGLGDDVTFRNAVQRFWLSKPREPLREFGDVTRRSGAERELARLGESDPSVERRAVALTMRGALLLEEAGKQLQAMMEMGSAAPWPEALKALSGETKADASAIIDYFEPLSKWLKEQNKGKACGW